MKFAGLLTLCLAGAVGAETLPVDRGAVWFKPSLTVNSAPICAEVLRTELDTFFSTSEQSEYAQVAGWESVEADPATSSLPTVEIVKDRYDELILTRPGGQRVFTKDVSQGGCGGGCETRRILVSGQQFDPSQLLSGNDEWPGTPRAPEWRLYQASDREFYALGVVEDRHLRAYRLAGPGSVELACEVMLKPDGISSNEDPAIQRAWQSAQALSGAYGEISQGAGSCGTLRAHERRYEYLAQALYEAMYRPWAAHVSGGESTPFASNLETWALGGVAQYRANLRYRQQLERTTADLADFYQRKFSWSKSDAQKQAAAVIANVLDRGFAFSPYGAPPSDGPLRQAILEHQPMENIRRFEPARKQDQQVEMVYGYDSILNMAVEYPEALQYLLSKGLDPNVTNAFGKTPLMYAAQFNQLESARILLAAGADPNARTFLPEDQCYYTLNTSGMTPLHYAARYASAPVIVMLVEQGAATFAKTLKSYPEVEESPLDWLRADTNPNIQAAELPALYEALRIPTEEDRRQIAAKILARAQAEYARSEYKLAYRSLQLALSAQPDNEKVLADLPLMAFKAGEFADAIKAARQIIADSKSMSLQASAWFNLGVTCEREDVRGQYFREGSCDGDWITPFVQAWKVQPTRARADKLRQIFNRPGSSSCSAAGGSQALSLWSLETGYGMKQRIFILHAVGDPLNIESIPKMTRVFDNLPVNDRAITVLEYPKTTAPLKINGQTCGR